MTQTEALVGLNLLYEIGSIRLKKLLEHYATAQEIITASCDELKRIEGIGEEIAYDISQLKSEDIDNEFRLIKKYGLDILTVCDDDYPENLKSIYDPPIVLYVKGNLTAQDKLSIGIVGSRRASFYGLNSAEKFAYELAGLGFTVVSGLAYGIDTQAHKGALKADGRTIAVLGSGLANIYPSENKKLAGQISQSGAVISEFPLSAAPLPNNFPRRNRIISGLSLGLLVVEAAKNSGALITADFALEQGREVFALPGKIDSGNSFGTNGLIKQGAKLVSNIEDILEELNFTEQIALPKEAQGFNTLKLGDASFSEAEKESSKIGELTSEESNLYNTLSRQPQHLDDIVDKLGLTTAKTLNMLLTLEIKKFIRQFPGKQFARVTNRQ